MQFAIAIHLAAHLPGVPHKFDLASILPSPLAHWAPEPGVEAAGMDAQERRNHHVPDVGERVGKVAIILDKGVSLSYYRNQHFPTKG